MRILRKQKSTYALSLFLVILGVAAILFTIWKTWPQVSSAKDPVSTFMNLLGTETLSFTPVFELKLIYLFASGDALLILGVLLYVLSVQWFYLPGKIVWFRCPFCNKDWRSTGDKALVHCPHCRQLVHPILIEKKDA